MAFDLKLYCRNLAIGIIRNAFCDDETWHGEFQLGLSPTDSKLARQIVDFIHFVEDWNERVGRNESPDPKEFDQYSDLIKSGHGLPKTKRATAARSLTARYFLSGAMFHGV
jgi:hypothetical protein